MTRSFPQSRIQRRPLTSNQTAPPPQLPKDSFDLPPEEARSERQKLKHRERLFSLATAGALLYLLLLLWGAGDLFIRQTALKRLRHEIDLIQTPSLEAQKESALWHSFRSSIDPPTYALHRLQHRDDRYLHPVRSRLLAAVAAPTEGGKVRLTLFSLEQNRLQISGEATDVTQAYNFIEALKKNPLLQEYDWNAGQPQLAGKDSVKFDIEGTPPGAPHETTGPQ